VQTSQKSVVWWFFCRKYSGELTFGDLPGKVLKWRAGQKRKNRQSKVEERAKCIGLLGGWRMKLVCCM